MATQTTNYGLTKPSYNETADIGVINSNMDIIDAKMKAIENKAGSGGGGGNTDTYGHVKVGSVTIDASGDDTIELVAGSNVTLTPDTTSKSVTISATGGGGSGTSDYLQLSNKPKINGVELVGNTTTEDLGIVVPQYTSELVNDSGFITNETDPTVPAWAKEPNKPTYTAEEVGALPSNTHIPDPTSVVVDRFVSEGTHIADISVNGEKTELYAPTGGGGTSVTVDSELSTTSENPVQNKVITQALNEKSNLISDAWNASTTYAVGQYCIYNNSLWKCLVQHSGQTPTEGTYWTKVSVANEITSLNNSLIANSKHFYFDYKDGKYGYNTNPNRGADTFVPFKSGVDSSIKLQLGTISFSDGNSHDYTYNVPANISIIGCYTSGDRGIFYGVLVENDITNVSYDRTTYSNLRHDKNANTVTINVSTLNWYSGYPSQTFGIIYV